MRRLRSFLAAALAMLGTSWASDAEKSATYFVYIKLAEGLEPLDRGAKYEDPLESDLAASALGEVTGGGSQLGEERPDGTHEIAFSGIDVDLTDLARGLELLRRRLVELGAPEGTELHYSEGETKLQDELRGEGWVLRKPRTFLHPGFGI